MNKNNGDSKRTILIVDDDRLILATLSRGLEQAGYTVFQASSGMDALPLAIEHEPDIAILDMRMPHMSGIELALHLKEETSVPFLFLSAYGETDIVRQAAEHGAVGYVIKPADIPQIIPAIEAGLARAADIRRLRQAEVDLTTALATGRETNVAVGILMERRHLSRADAFDILRRYARGQQRKIHEVASELIQGAEMLNLVRQDDDRKK